MRCRNQSLSSTLDTLRVHLGAALAPRTDSPDSGSSLSRRISSTLTSLLDLPPSGATPPGSTSQPARTAFNPQHESVPVASVSAEVEPTDALPAYSRRPPASATEEAEIPQPRLHTFTSKSKLKLQVLAPGQTHIVLFQKEGEDKMWLSGGAMARSDHSIL